MSEYFPTEAVRGLWEERRAVVLGHLRAAIAPLAAEGLETRDIHGWALWARLKSWTVDITTSVPFSESDHLAMLERAMKVTEFGPGRPVVREGKIASCPAAPRWRRKGAPRWRRRRRRCCASCVKVRRSAWMRAAARPGARPATRRAARWSCAPATPRRVKKKNQKTFVSWRRAG
ncbi:hypothetical protein [Teichococcus aestuarii]|uniref:hypothetical protein n=1 Tax=Teichococcus aestuarii TaxID=568898 RepID=UPI00360664F6